MRATRRTGLLVVIALALSLAETARAIEPSNVLVLYNSAVPDSIAVKDAYLLAHPGVNTLDIYHPDLPTGEYITADQYLSLVRPAVLAGVNTIEGAGGRVDAFATTKGLPLRIEVTEPQPPSQFPQLPTYTDPWGVQHQIVNWRPFSSLESELAAIDRIASWEMMGDQSYAISNHFVRNPYYKQNAAFNHDVYGTRLAARLDGYTVSDVTTAINKAQNAFIGPDNQPGGPRHFIVDNDLSQAYTNSMTKVVDEVLVPAGLPLTGNNDGTYVGTAPGPVIGYDSHGVHQSTTPDNYIQHMTTVLGTTLADGAVFHSLESFNAYTFNEGGYIPNSDQGQVGQWLKFGGTAGVGYVEEPYASWPNVCNEDWLFKGLLDGKTFVEAAWSANYQMSYVNTVVGDPLMVWRTLMLGDVNVDGMVDISDLAIMGENWGDTTMPGGPGWGDGDMNSDGMVDIADLSLMGPTWGQMSSWAMGAAPQTSGYDPWELGSAIGQFIHPNPEPSTVVLLASGLAILPLCRRWMKNRRGHCG